MEELLIKWEEIKEHIKKDLDMLDVSYNAWILPLKIYKIENDDLIISAPDNIKKEGIKLIENRYAFTIQVCIEEFTGSRYNLIFILESQKYDNHSPERESHNIIQDNIRLQNDTATESIDNTRLEFSNLNVKYTFDTFVEGPNNSLAKSAAEAVILNPGYTYNPLFIWGGPGLGKTHLMHAIGHEIMKRNSNMKVLYVTSERFTTEIVDSVRSGNQAKYMAIFREKYRNVDVLLLDDIQFIIGKEGTQEEFFNTFNVLHSSNKAIIISSDRPPKDLKTLEERLISRFSMGIITDIQPPNYETRMAILKKNAEKNGIVVDDEIIQFIATKIHTNIRDLEGSFNNMIQLSKMKKEDHITLETAKDAIKDRVDPDDNRIITADHIIDSVCSYFNIKKDNIISNKRSNDIAYPRQIIMYLCKTMTNLNMVNIGKALGDRDHATIIYGVKKIEKEINQKNDVKETVEAIAKLIENN